MTGWDFLAIVLCSAIASLLGFCWGVQHQRDEQAAADEFAASLEPEPQQEQPATPPGWLPLVFNGPRTEAQKRINAMRQHPAGGRQ